MAVALPRSWVALARQKTQPRQGGGGFAWSTKEIPANPRTAYPTPSSCCCRTTAAISRTPVSVGEELCPDQAPGMMAASQPLDGGKGLAVVVFHWPRHQPCPSLLQTNMYTVRYCSRVDWAAGSQGRGRTIHKDRFQAKVNVRIESRRHGVSGFWYSMYICTVQYCASVHETETVSQSVTGSVSLPSIEISSQDSSWSRLDSKRQTEGR